MNRRGFFGMLAGLVAAVRSPGLRTEYTDVDAILADTAKITVTYRAPDGWYEQDIELSDVSQGGGHEVPHW